MKLATPVTYENRKPHASPNRLRFSVVASLLAAMLIPRTLWA